MKINFAEVDITDFNMVDCKFGGDDCVWIYPHLEGVKWTPNNLHLRSSIWRKSDGQLISAGFKKFFNWMQEPNIYPPPDALSEHIKVVEKLDGSCLIVSKYNGELIIRTRRALADTMLNGDEIALFKKKYPEVFNWAGLEVINNKDRMDDGPYSLIFEWLTPTNQIVLKYPEPEIRLIGCINHENYKYVGQWQLDALARIFEVQRPKYFKYKNIEEMLQNIADLKGEEGVCVYYGNDQHIRKIKSDWYLSVHNFRNAMNLKNIVDLYFTQGMPNYQGFCDAVVNQFDWEGYFMALPLISQVCDGMTEVKKILEGMQRFLEKNNTMKNAFDKNGRKDIAKKIYESYGNTSRADIVFTLLDKQELSKNQWKKLLFQVLTVK